MIILSILAVDRLTAQALGWMTMSSEFRLSRIYSGRAAADVAIFGNSRAVHSFYAPELGVGSCKRVVNFAYNGLSMAAVEALIIDYLARNPTPKALMLEISAVYAQGGGDQQLTPFMEPGSALRRYLLRQENTLIPWNAVFSSLRFNSVLLLRVIGYMGKSDQTWINRLTPIRQEGVAPPEGTPKRRYDVDSENIKALNRIAALAEARGIALVPVVAPYHHTVTRQINSPYGWIEKAESALPTGTIVLDMSHAFEGDAEFQDFQHLNIVGARAQEEIFNERLSELPLCNSETGS